MAEVVGLVSAGAGLASLALQLMETAIKLKALVHAYKDAPQTLESLVFEIETFSLILLELERDRQAHDTSAGDLIARCVLLCQWGVERVRTSINRLERIIRRGKLFGQLVTALEGKEVFQIFQELERAKSTLGLAHGIYLESRRKKDSHQSLSASMDMRGMMVQQQSIIESQTRDIRELRNDFRRLATTVTATDISRTIADRQASKRCCRRSTMTDKSFRAGEKPPVLKISAWLISKIWQISLGKTHAGWDLKLRAWNVRPTNAHIFELCTQGDLLGVQRLIAAGEASYYDIDENGITLLNVSSYRERDLCHVPTDEMPESCRGGSY